MKSHTLSLMRCIALFMGIGVASFALAAASPERHYLSVNTRLTVLDAEGATLSDWRVISLSGTAYVDSMVAKEIIWCPGSGWEPWVFTDGWVKLLPSSTLTIALLDGNGGRTGWYQILQRYADGSIAPDDPFYDPDYETPPPPPPPSDDPPSEPPSDPQQLER